GIVDPEDGAAGALGDEGVDREVPESLADQRGEGLRGDRRGSGLLRGRRLHRGGFGVADVPQLRGADPDDVAVLQRVLLALLAGDEGALAAARMDHGPVGADLDLAMDARDRRIGQASRGGLAPADLDRFPDWQRESPTFDRTGNDDELVWHRRPRGEDTRG